MTNEAVLEAARTVHGFATREEGFVDASPLLHI
jgi:hypothetical protein